MDNLVHLTKKEQILGLELLNSSINRRDQNIFISTFFYSVVCRLKKFGLVKSIKNGRNCNYKLTDDGYILFSIIANFKGNEEYKKNAIKGTKIIVFS
jgi:hypothetical protein